MNEELVLAQNVNEEDRRKKVSRFLLLSSFGLYLNQNCLCNKINFWGVKKITWWSEVMSETKRRRLKLDCVSVLYV